MKFNHEIFFTHVRTLHFKWAKTGLNQSQVDGINFLLKHIEADSIWKSIETIAYAMATTAWETAWTFQPINERGGDNYFVRLYWTNRKKANELGNLSRQDAIDFSGKGDVQLTGRNNYTRATKEIRKQMPALVTEFEQRTRETFDLVKNPHQAKDPLIAYAVLALGMHQGWFTGKRFSTYKKNLYLNWRRIINGTDCDDQIASIAIAFEKAFRLSLISESTATDGKLTDKPASNPANNSQKSETNSQPLSLDEPASQSVQNTSEDAPKLNLPSFDTVGEYFGKAQATAQKAQETLDNLKVVKDALGTRTDGKKSLWSMVGQIAYQTFWAVVAFIAGIPLEVWLVVAIIAAALGILYLYRQNSLGKIRETAHLKLIEIAEFIK